MTDFQKQMEALGSALLLSQRLQEDTVWALTCTNDDDAESPTVLNIFAKESEWPVLRQLLRLGKSIDRSEPEIPDKFISWRQGTLLISFIEQHK